MRFSAAVLAACLSSAALAQRLTERQLGNLPACAQSCVTGNFQGCQGLDIACICGKASLIADLSCCVSKSCDAADQQATITFAQQLCLTYHITVPTVAGCTGTGAAASSSSAPGSSSSSAASAASNSASTSASAAASSAASSGSAAASNTGSASGSGSSSVSGSGSATAAQSTNLAGPVQSAGAVVGMCAAAVAGLVAIL